MPYQWYTQLVLMYIVMFKALIQTMKSWNWCKRSQERENVEKCSTLLHSRREFNVVFAWNALRLYLDLALLTAFCCSFFVLFYKKTFVGNTLIPHNKNNDNAKVNYGHVNKRKRLHSYERTSCGRLEIRGDVHCLYNIYLFMLETNRE